MYEILGGDKIDLEMKGVMVVERVRLFFKDYNFKLSIFYGDFWVSLGFELFYIIIEFMVFFLMSCVWYGFWIFGSVYD